MKRVSIAVVVLAISTLMPLGWAAGTEKVLHNFQNNGADGYYPEAAVIFDASGNLYGTTIQGGGGKGNICEGNGCGMVFEMTPKAGGGWTEAVLHSFNSDGTDGNFPAAGLIFDAVGDLYGTTAGGGAYDHGTVFELSPQVGSGWTEAVLYSFGGADGSGPAAGLVFDAAGNLYGTTAGGGAYNFGTVFELSPQVSGGWTQAVLHSFNGNAKDGAYPEASLTFDAAGNLYGTTYGGGAYTRGTVFELTPQTGGGWKETVVHSFLWNGKDGYFPDCALIIDAGGNLYGTTVNGGPPVNGCGSKGCGTVFELSPKAGGSWKEKILHNFSNNGKDGLNSSTGLIFDAFGNLYGTTNGGGAHYDGTVFELSPRTGGRWTEKVMHSFNGKNGNGSSALIFDASGNLYGTTAHGGTGKGCGGTGCGTAFEISP